MSELLEFILLHEEAFKSRNRLASLYADFSLQRTTNPEGYTANLLAWQRALSRAAAHGTIPTLGDARNLLSIRGSEDLLRALQHPTFGRPSCLPAVFHDAKLKGEWLLRKEFMTRREGLYDRSWNLNPLGLPVAVVKWGLRTVGVLGDGAPVRWESARLGTEEYIVLSNVERAAEEVLQRMETHTFTVDRVLSRHHFHTLFADVLSEQDTQSTLSDPDIDVLLIHLARDKKALWYDTTSKTIKFKAPSEHAPQPITQEDIAIANLRDTLHKIQRQIAPLEERIATQDAAARAAVKINATVAAKSALRSKRFAEQALAERSAVLLQLESVYSQLQSASDQVEIVTAMRDGAVALKGLNAKVGGADGVAAVVDALKEEMDTADEITNIINEGTEGVAVDEEEVEDEFEELERAEKEKKERHERAKKEKDDAERFARQMAELERVEREAREKELAERQRAKEERRKMEIEGDGDTTAEQANDEGKPVEQEKEDDDVESASQELAKLQISFQNFDAAETKDKDAEMEDEPKRVEKEEERQAVYA